MNKFDVQLQNESSAIINAGIHMALRRDYRQSIAQSLALAEQRKREDPMALLLAMAIMLFGLIVFVFCWDFLQKNETFYQ